jgi:DNA-binding IclR family transcriptional regulator
MPTEPADEHESNEADSPSILSKAFQLLSAFNPYARVMSLSELSRASGLPKSTVHRLLARLVELGAVERHLSGYKLGLGLLKLGASTPAGYMRDLSVPHLAKLHRWCGETVFLGVLRNFDVVYLEKFESPGSPASIAQIGSRLPANCTALGKALMAHEDLDELARLMPRPLPGMTSESVTDPEVLIRQLRQIRAEGIARERNEAQPGLACHAAPLVMRGFAVGAISVGFPSTGAPPPKLEVALLETAAAIVRDIDAGLAQGRQSWFPREP